MALISALNKARLRRLSQTCREVYAETGSLPRTMTHMMRFIGRKLLPLFRYGSFTFLRLFVVSRLRHRNDRLGPSIPTVGIRILGGVGDYIVIARYLRDLQACAGPFVFDIYSNRPALASWIFSAVSGFRASYDEAIFSPTGSGYTLAMQISQFIVVEDQWMSPHLAAQHPRLAGVAQAIRRIRPSIAPIIAEHPRLDSFLAQKAIFANRGRRDYLHFMSDVTTYGGDAIGIGFSEAARQQHGLTARPYVTVHNGYDPNMVVSHVRATKCYPYFDQVIAMLRESHPDMTFVQIGIHTSQPIGTADMNLIGETTLPEAAGLIRGAVLHIDNEGGLVHLAAAMGTRSCVVFGPTSARYFGYPANMNVEPSFCGGCWWITETWMNHCPRRFARARCMTEQPAAVIARAAEGLFPTGAEILSTAAHSVLVGEGHLSTTCDAGGETSADGLPTC
jgi:hypothetical protein